MLRSAPEKPTAVPARTIRAVATAPQVEHAASAVPIFTVLPGPLLHPFRSRQGNHSNTHSHADPVPVRTN
jgi:hypothetical protein